MNTSRINYFEKNIDPSWAVTHTDQMMQERIPVHLEGSSTRNEVGLENLYDMSVCTNPGTSDSLTHLTSSTRQIDKNSPERIKDFNLRSYLFEMLSRHDVLQWLKVTLPAASMSRRYKPKGHISTERKIEAVKMYAAGTNSNTDVCNLMHISTKTLYEYVHRINKLLAENYGKERHENIDFTGDGVDHHSSQNLLTALEDTGTQTWLKARLSLCPSKHRRKVPAEETIKLVGMYLSGKYKSSDLCSMLDISKTTLHRYVDKTVHELNKSSSMTGEAYFVPPPLPDFVASVPKCIRERYPFVMYLEKLDGEGMAWLRKELSRATRWKTYTSKSIDAVKMYATGKYGFEAVCSMVNISRPTLYRYIEKINVLIQRRMTSRNTESGMRLASPPGDLPSVGALEQNDGNMHLMDLDDLLDRVDDRIKQDDEGRLLYTPSPLFES